MEWIYKETDINVDEVGNGWEVWGNRITTDSEKKVWRKKVSKEEAEHYYSENELLD